MGTMFCYGPCFGCSAVFGFNPDLVPSIRDDNDVRQPICPMCVTRANPERRAHGLALIIPHPGAYEPGPDTGL